MLRSEKLNQHITVTLECFVSYTWIKDGYLWITMVSAEPVAYNIYLTLIDIIISSTVLELSTFLLTVLELSTFLLTVLEVSTCTIYLAITILTIIAL